MFILLREKDTDEALKKMPKQIEAFYQKTLKKEESLKEKQAKRQEILDQGKFLTIFPNLN